MASRGKDTREMLGKMTDVSLLRYARRKNATKKRMKRETGQGGTQKGKIDMPSTEEWGWGKKAPGSLAPREAKD